MAFKNRFTKEIFVGIALVFLASCVSTLTIDLDEPWEMFKRTFGKKYETKCEEVKRRQIFEKNVKFIAKHNLQENMGLHSFTLGINKMTDMDAEEFKTWGKCYKSSAISYSLHHLNLNDTKENEIEPEDLDYRNETMVTEVIDQGECNACYAFAAMGALEAQTKKKTGHLIPLSVQNIIDCSKLGCEPADIIDAYEYVRNNTGVSSLNDYAYHDVNGTCKFNPTEIAATVTSVGVIPKDEETLLHAVKTIGPISVAINGNTQLFQHYKSGIIDHKNCTGDLTHAVLIIGYGHKDGKPYWLAKNSFGKTWGENGFFRILRGNNMCRITDAASYPVV